MADPLKKLMCCMLLLALVGTASGAGYCAAEQAGIAVPMNQPVAGSINGDKGLSSITGESGSNTIIATGLPFPDNQPACVLYLHHVLQDWRRRGFMCSLLRGKTLDLYISISDE